MSAKSNIDAAAADEKQKVPQIPGYTIEKPLGKGAMAAVYLAVQNALERQVALKVMASSLSVDETFRRRFVKEGRIIGQLSHQHIITVYDIGEYEGYYYMAMEYIGHGTLRERIERGMPPERAVSILCQIAKALGYAHGRGFVHRDVKPANILFRDDETAVLSDFGIARGFDESTRLTMAGWTLGTPNYMSPEQALGKTLDARSDLYALGVVFYEMLVGARPYKATDSISLALKHVSEPIPRLPDNLAIYQGIIDNLLAKDPNDRFAHAEELIKAATHVQTTGKAMPPPVVKRTETVTPPPKPPAVSPAPPSKKTWIGWLVGIVLVLLLGGAGAYLAMNRNVVTPTPTPQPVQPPKIANVSEQIASHLRIAAANLNIGFLISPYNLNATYGYCEVLKLDANNAAALRGLDDVARAYAQQPETNRDELHLALGMVQGCLGSAPNNPSLLSLRERIQQQIGQSQ
ncbi:MAG: serine/threonine protein kinase [Gammaproteobacteria bacterium]|nr:serine/threonine protein kinase [Gammaproteobacteria bacterium]MCP5423847.1 serine/threonine protein kinase [Gammaproteobacteria bacterium]